MLEKLISSLGRLVGSTERPENTQTVQDERRVWVRYPCSVQVSYQPADAQDGASLAARVENISHGGIGLVVDRPFEPGKFLSVELPAPEGQGVTRVLAYVLHSTPHPEAGWAVGCTFSLELGDEDLQAFGARRVKPRASHDQRGWVRFPCPVKANYQVVRTTPTAPRAAQVVDISASGLGLMVERAIEVGTLLSVDLRGADGQASLTMLASVVRLTEQAGKEWLLGCSFIRELSAPELRALL